MKWQNALGNTMKTVVKSGALMLPMLLMLCILGNLSSSVLADAYTQGAKKILVVKVDFSDKMGDPAPDATVKAVLQQVFDFYKIDSQSTFSVAKIDITPVYRLTQTAAFYEANGDDQLRIDGFDAGAKGGFDYRNYDFPILVFPSLAFTFGGKAYVGAPQAWVNGEFDFRVLAHELGHNLGLGHANFYLSPGPDPLFGEFIEYGDVYDAMGANYANTDKAHFNTAYKNDLDWMAPSGIQAVASSGVYRIQEHDNINALGIRALTTPFIPGANYWIEYRRQFNNPWLLNGALIRVQPQPGRSRSASTILLDMTPGSSPDFDREREDAALVVGRTYSDTSAKVHITPIRVIAGTINELEINVNLGDFPGNGAPQVKITASATQVNVNTPVIFNAQATDPDGDSLAFYWDFADRTFGPNAATATKAWSASGDYVVRCTVSDMKGGTGVASVAVKVGNPTSVRVSGLVLSSCGAPVNGATVQVAAQNISTTTNTDGTYTLTGLKPGKVDVTASSGGTAIAPANFTNPVDATFDVENINFGATQKDNLDPTITIDKPLDGSIVANLSASGTALDNQGGCGIARIEYDVERLVDNKHWNGFGWVDGESNLTVISNGDSWKKVNGLPVDKDLDAGAYRIKVEAFDQTFNQDTDSVTVVVPEAPVISITKPLNGAVLAELPSVEGTAKDPAQGNLTISYKVQRLSDGRYFNGSTWIISHPDVAPNFQATYNSTTGLWSSTSNLPTPNQLISGAYRVIATAATDIGRTASAVSSFLVDRGAPFVAYTKPVAGGSINSLSDLVGYAIDNPGAPGATGISKVVVRIMRESDKKWWTGTEWGALRTDLPTTLTNKQFPNGGGVEWKGVVAQLPKASQTLPGAYTLQAVAYDAAGNLAGTSIRVTLDKDAPLVEIFLPKNNAIVTNLVTRGTARDAISGIDKVTLTIQRDSDKKYWDGAMWSGPKALPPAPFPTASLLVGSYNGGLIKEFDAATGAPLSTFANRINHPESIEFGPDVNSDGFPELFVSERLANRVLFYDGKTKELLGVFAQGNGLIYPTGLLFMPNGDLLVANGHGEGKKPDGSSYTYASFPTSIKRFDIKTRAYLGDFVLPNAGGVSNGFEGICWGNDANGDGVADLYAAALFDDKIPVYSGVDGTFIREFVIPKDGGLSFPTDVQFGPDNTGDGVRDCYVNSSGSDAIKLYDGVSGAFVKDFVADNNGATFDLNGPERLRFGPDGQLYVSSFGTPNANAGSGSTVLRFDPTTGAANPSAGHSKAIFAVGDLNGPAGLAFNPIASGQVTPPPPGPAVMVIPTLNTNYAPINYVFARGAGLPVGNNLLPGRYIIAATGFDRAGNSATHTISVIVGSLPTVSITTPANGSTVSGALTVSGEAQSTAGIARVLVYLQRNSDNRYWTGGAWGARTALNTTLTANATGARWTRTAGLPSGAQLTSGTYRLEAVAYDNNNQTATAVSQFSVTSSGGGGGGDTTVTVSETTATASNRIVKLVFTGLLNAQSATTPTNYTLTINDKTVNVDQAIYSASNQSVLLKPPANTLRPNDRVQVAWNLIDSLGRATKGKTDVFIAAP